MSMLFSIFMFLFILWVAFKVVPAILGFTFSLGILCLLFDAVLIFLIITLFKVIF